MTPYLLLLAEPEHGLSPVEEHATGFPPFDTWHWASQAFWLVVTFAILYFVLSRAILPRLSATLERRQDTIVGSIDEAARLNEQADEARRVFEAQLADARARARATAEEAMERSRETIARETEKTEAELTGKLEAAEARIAATRTKAMAEVQTVASEAAVAMIERLGGKATGAAVTKAVADALAPKEEG